MKHILVLGVRNLLAVFNLVALRRRAEVLIHGIPAGILEEIETGKK